MKSRCAGARVAWLGALALIGLAGQGQAYTLEYGKWGSTLRPSGAVITWSFMNDGVGIDTMYYKDSALTGTNQLSHLRATIDGQYGTGAFDAAVKRAMATWAAAVNVTFVQVNDDNAAFAGQTAINIRIGAYQFATGSEGAVGYGPPGDAIHFPDPLSGNIAFDLNDFFQIAPGKQGDPLPRPGGVYYNDVEGLTLHELGHTLGLGHSTVPLAVMCGYLSPSFDGSLCRYDLINRVLNPDDSAGMLTLYGPAIAASGTDGPLPPWSIGALALGLLGIALRRNRSNA